MPRDHDNHIEAVTHGAAVSVLETYREWLEAIPFEADTATTVELLAAIAAATEAGQLTAELATRAAKQVLDRIVIVDSLTRRVSEFEGGWGCYLVCACHDPATGETFEFTTGAQRPSAMLIKAHHERWLPLKVMLSQSAKKTKAGFYPLNLTVYGREGDF